VAEAAPLDARLEKHWVSLLGRFQVAAAKRAHRPPRRRWNGEGAEPDGRHEINPQVYLSQLLIGLQDTPVSQLDQWLPDQWKKSQAATGPQAAPTLPVH
jgi:hypothetical protein